MTPELEYCWRGDITDAELVALTESLAAALRLAGGTESVRTASDG
jgi:hypothetical protein